MNQEGFTNYKEKLDKLVKEMSVLDCTGDPKINACDVAATYILKVFTISFALLKGWKDEWVGQEEHYNRGRLDGLEASHKVKLNIHKKLENEVLELRRLCEMDTKDYSDVWEMGAANALMEFQCRIEKVIEKLNLGG